MTISWKQPYPCRLDGSLPIVPVFFLQIMKEMLDYKVKCDILVKQEKELKAQVIGACETAYPNTGYSLLSSYF